MSDSDSIDAWKALSLSVSTTRRCMTAVCAGVGSEGDDNAAEQIPDVEVMQPSGFMANPTLTATTEAMSVRRGDELIALFLVDKGAPAQAVESGETRLYGVGASNSAAVIRIRADGSIEVTSAGNGHVTVTANGTGEIRLNGSALKVAADTDPVNVGTWTHVPAGGTGVSPCSLSYTPPGGSSTPIGAGTAVAGKVSVTASRRVKTTG